MSATKVAIGAGVVLFGVLCWLAAAGVSALTPLLITAGALVVMVGGGNWLSGRSSPRARPRTGAPTAQSRTGAPTARPPTGAPTAQSPTGAPGAPSGADAEDPPSDGRA